MSSEIVIVYVQGRDLQKEEIQIAIEACIDNCKETKGTPCYNGEKDGSNCNQCRIIKDIEGAAGIICRKKIIEYFNNIKEVLGVDEIQNMNCFGDMSFGKDGKLYWKESESNVHNNE